MVQPMSEEFLAGVDFPASKLELIDTAADAGAPQELVERLQQLQSERYESREELEAELRAGA
jgi:hypothetical protein